MKKKKYKITESPHGDLGTSTYKLYVESTFLFIHYWKKLKTSDKKSDMNSWCLEYSDSEIEYEKIIN